MTPARHHTRSTSRRTRTSRVTSAKEQSPRSATTRSGIAVPFGLTVALVLLLFVPRVHANTTLTISLGGTALALFLWQANILARAKRNRIVHSLEVVLRPQHYVQAAVQLSVFLYWGWYWRPVYDHASLLLAQLLFAYAFDMLLAWSRRAQYTVGFGPFPIIFSTNLFLWFRDDWFFLQFLMIAVGFLGKEYVRWLREGRYVHIFNPSAFSLGLFSLVLIATSSTHLTWGEEIATTLSLAPHIYLFLFLAGLIVMYCFEITLVAGVAAMMLFGLSAVYAAATGVPYFIDSEIPTAVFLGLHLLVTDPSTSPRTQLGKILFGMIYGLGVFCLYALLGSLGVPTFYDKLLAVPLLNLSVRWIDRLVAVVQSQRAVSILNGQLIHSNANVPHIAVWVVMFVAMTALGATDGRHRGDSVPFWDRACLEGRRNACTQLLQIEASYCADASAWSCNELGRHYADGKIVQADKELALEFFGRACELRFQPACLNLLTRTSTFQAHPKSLDLRLLLREGGPNLLDMPEGKLQIRACEHAWDFACGEDLQ